MPYSTSATQAFLQHTGFTIKNKVARFELYISGMENRCKTIKAIEVVQVRLFDMNNGPKVVGIFQREAGLSQHPLQATLFQSPLIPNDWSICFWRSSSAENGSKSPGGVRCAEALRSIGLVDHTVWQQTTNGNSPTNPPQGLVARASI
jgi:hypothetical protein